MVPQWTASWLSTTNPVRPTSLWEAGDSGGRAAALLTWPDAWFSTIHSPYYCS